MQLDHFGAFSKVLSLMGFIPFRVEMQWERDRFLYTGLSPLFEEIGGEIEVPVYSLTIHNNDKGEPAGVEAERLEPALPRAPEMVRIDNFLVTLGEVEKSEQAQEVCMACYQSVEFAPNCTHDECPLNEKGEGPGVGELVAHEPPRHQASVRPIREAPKENEPGH